MALLILVISSGNHRPSTSRGRSYTKGLTGRYVGASFLRVKGSTNFGLTLCLIEPTREPMCVYKRISCHSLLQGIAEATQSGGTLSRSR